MVNDGGTRGTNGFDIDNYQTWTTVNHHISIIEKLEAAETEPWSIIR